MVAVHVYESDQALVYVSAVPSGEDFPEHMLDAIHGILSKYPVVAGVGEETYAVTPEGALSARMTVDDAKLAADEIANYLMQWRAST